MAFLMMKCQCWYRDAVGSTGFGLKGSTNSISTWYSDGGFVSFAESALWEGRYPKWQSGDPYTFPQG